LRRDWRAGDVARIRFPKRVVAEPLPDRPDAFAFIDGPVALAGLCAEERTLTGDPADPTTFLAPDREREWDTWLGGYHTVGQDVGLRFIPLHDVIDETYTVYFPMRSRA
jgi:hypothetical protein